MATFLVTFGVFALAALGLGVGWLLSGRELKGSCGGLAAASGEPCPVCGGRPADCDAGQQPGGDGQTGGVRRHVPGKSTDGGL